MEKLAGKVALVTGGGSGIGRATALAFARAGARVVIGNRSEAAGRETVGLIEGAGGTARFKPTDVTVARDVAALVDYTVEEFGALDAAFNNAGIFADLAPITEQAESDYDRVMTTNVKGVWLALKYEIRQMLEQGGGVIVNNASVGGLIGSRSGSAPYHASKHAVIGLTKCAALENARKGIRVNCVSPAVIETDMSTHFAESLSISMQQFGDMHPIGRVGTAEEVAGGVVWLCSDEATFVTGHNLVIDGGFTAQ
jgi:NAD(P)-dependent dehydrogenase (short-subunit alcohol dehydrogenase family)